MMLCPKREIRRLGGLFFLQKRAYGHGEISMLSGATFG